MRWALVLACVTGCSFAVVRRPTAERMATDPTSCTRTPFPPFVDGLVTLVGATTATLPPTEDTLVRTSGLVTALVAASSAIYGTIELVRCVRGQGPPMHVSQR